MKHWLIAAVLMLAAGSAQAGSVYRWVDGQGKVHFGDRPPPKVQAQEITTRIQSYANVVEVVDEPGAGDRIVRVLTTSWCGVCKRAKSWLGEKGVTYIELDVENTPTGKSEYKRLKGQGVPIILVGSRRMNGFSPERLEQLLREAGYNL